MTCRISLLVRASGACYRDDIITGRNTRASGQEHPLDRESPLDLLCYTVEIAVSG